MAQIGTLAINLMAETASFNSDIERATAHFNESTARMTRAMQGFADRATRETEALGRTIVNLSDAFGPPKQAWEAARKAAAGTVKQMQADYSDGMERIRQIATQALEGVAPDSAKLDLGGAALRASAEEAARYAKAMAIVEAEVNAAALAQGKANSAYGIDLQAARSAVVAAERKAAALAKEAAGLELLEVKLKAAGLQQNSLNETMQHAATRSEGQRAALQQLSYQFNDIATGIASGQKPLMIFAQQSGQVVQALSLMGNGTKGFLGFLAGPWGMALTAATLVATPFVAKLFEGAEAAKAVEMANSGLAAAQGALGDVFDKTTGRIKTQNEILLLNARLTAINLRSEAMKAGMAADVAGGKAGERSWGDILSLSPRFGRRNVDVGAKELIAGVKAGNISGSDAIKKADAMNFAGVNISKAEVITAIRDAATSRLSGLMAEKIDKSLDSGRLLGGILTPDRSAAGPRRSGGSSDMLGRVNAGANLLSRIDEQLANARQANADDAVTLAQSAKKQVQIDAEKLMSDIELAFQKKQLTVTQAQIARGKVGEIVAQQEARIVAEKQASLARATLELDRTANDNQRELLNSTGALAATSAERRKIALQLLDLERKDREARLRHAIRYGDAGQRAAAQTELDALGKIYDAKRDVVIDQTASPLQKYHNDLEKAAKDAGEALETLAVDSLKNLNQGLADAIMGLGSFEDVLGNTAMQVANSLLKMVLQQAVIDPLVSLGGSLLGLPGYATGTESAAPGLALVGEQGPELVRFRGGERVIPNHQLRMAGSGGAPGEVVVRVEASEYFDARVQTNIDARAPGLVRDARDQAISRNAWLRQRSLAA